MKLNYSLNFILLALLMLVMCGLETSFWFQLFGSVPAPLLWVNLLIYIALYRKPTPAICVIYALGFIATAFTLMPLKMMFVNLAILFTLVYLVKSRFFWSGSGYYTIMCLFGAVVFHVTYFLTSLLLEPTQTAFQPTERLVQIILTPSFAFPMYWILARMDRWTRCEMLQESGGVEL